MEIARRGGQVVCSDIRLDAAEETVGLIQQAGGQALAVQTDVADFEAMRKLAVTADKWLTEPVNLVVNNAGVAIGGLNIEDASIEDWRWIVGVNMWGVVHGCHVFTPRLRKLGHGGIINVCSAASFAAAPQMGAYNLTKAAVLALSETLAAELSGTDIKVTALCPTFVKTSIIANGHVAHSASSLAQKLMDRAGYSPDKVAKMTLNALDHGQLYVLPQPDARLVWRMKRLAPVSYNRGSGLLMRLASRVTE
jgi:short-subunit dehydrogenase